MLTVLDCVVSDHDLRMVVLAGLFCMTASLTSVRLYARSLNAAGMDRAPWLLLAGLTGGAGIWATHFIAMLAYAPGLPVGYEPVKTNLSLVLAIAGTSGAFAINKPGDRVRQVAAGLSFGASVAAMHYCGMLAFRPQGHLAWDTGLVAASLLLVAVLGVCGMVAGADSRSWRRGAIGGTFLTLATCSLHFTAMSAVTIVLDPGLPLLTSVLARAEMATGVGMLTGIVLLAAVGLLLIDVQGRRDGLAKMRLLFDANPVPMWLVDVANLQILSVNDAVVRDYGYSREHLLQMSLFDVAAPEEHDALRAIIENEVGPYEGQRHWRFVRADGTEVIVEPFAQPIPYGDRTAYLAALFDVTARERANQALVEAKEAAEQASRAKGEFLANMSHEIRTPLNGVIGVAGALERSEVTAAQRDMINVIQSSASTLQRVLDDLLDSSRIERGEITIEARPFDLRRTVVALAGLYSQSAEEKGVDFQLDLAGAPEGSVQADPERVRQIVGNLLSNAVKFTDSGSVRLEVTAVGDRMRFVVSDTGIGFDEAFHDRLFKRFEQADPSVTRRFGGSGLGLSIARDLAERMGGALTAQSRPGEGSSFTLELPMPAVESVAVAGLRPLATAPARPLRVLLADDHPVNRRVVEIMLETANVELRAVEDGAQAVEAFATQTFDLVLMDMQMPVMDGLEATRRIRSLQSAGAASTPIYILSANALAEHIEASMAAGASDYLTKPISLEALYTALESVRSAMRLAA